MVPTLRRPGLASALAGLLVVGGCATNPATGRRQLSLVGEQQEIALGRDADRDVAASLGLYEDARLSAYVAEVGQRLATQSERPSLPWTFRVVDDPGVNAFALPGGFIYLTRGILAHLDSEAEMAAVLGHEIGHVTARHTVSRISKAQLATLGLGVGMILRPELQQYGDLAQAGLQLLFLKYSRDDENQADALGVRYVQRTDYEPREMVGVFDLLGRVGEREGSRVPSWLATHPDPEDRSQHVAALIESAAKSSGGAVGRDRYRQAIDGIVFGDDPRQGYFEEGVFYHPELRFQLAFPRGWETANQHQAVSALSGSRDALVVLTLAQARSREEAARRFFAQPQVRQGGSWRGAFHGLPATAHEFAALAQGGEVRGLAAFVEMEGRVYQLLGYTPAPRWSRWEGEIEHTLASFAPLRDRARLEVEPRRLEVGPLARPTALRELQRESGLPVGELAVLNRVSSDALLPAGTVAKRVVGGRGLPAVPERRPIP